MRTPRARRCVTLAPTVVLVCSIATSALAQQDQCPVGSTWKTKDDVGWCEPSVCDSDAQCAPGEICRPVPLCVEIGKIDPKAADATTTLMARQRCGADKSCPQSTVCSEKSRCLSTAAADKMGLLAAPAASASAPTPAPKKSSCGCAVPGRSTGALGASVAALVALALVVRRRRSFS